MSYATRVMIADLNAAEMARTHTVGFVSEVGDGTLRVRYSGPRGSGVSTMPVNAPLARVVGILREASGMTYGDLDGTEQVVALVPAPGASALTVDDIYNSREYAMWMYTA